MRGNIPSNLFKGDVIEASQHFFFHLIEDPRMASDTELKLCCTLVLLNEVQLAMVFGIVITQMSTRFNVFLEHWLLQFEIRLGVKDVTTAATGRSLRMLGASALDRKAPLRPKSALTDNLLHTLEPPRIIGMVIWKVKRLWSTRQGIDTIVHAWPLWVMCPETLWILGTPIRTKKM